MKYNVNDLVIVVNERRKRVNDMVGTIMEVDESDEKRPYKIMFFGNAYWFEEWELKPFELKIEEMVVKPKHYIGINGLEVEMINQNFLPKIDDGYVSHRVGSAVEYILRHPQKNGLEDLKKARENLNQIIDYLEKKGN